jgi:c-di-AMP phosphodiesterase-like protein
MTEFFKKLDEQIKQHDNVVIIGHQNPDLDCIGSSLGLYKAIEKECYIFKTTDKLNESMKKAFNIINEKDIKFIDKTNYKSIIKNTLLIIVDLHKKSLIENQEILEDIKDVVIIDHHIIGQDKINNILEFIDPKASSATEIVTRYMRYKGRTVDKEIATIMIAGIEIDTNGYNMKTTEETFNSSAFLMSLGADNILKQNILKENKDEYIKRTKLIENSYMLDNMMICVLDEKKYNPSYLATMSEDLLRFENVEASFTIGNLINDKIGISARSLGNINVENFMRELGGGGHITDAACQLDETSLKETEKRLTKVLKEVR